MALNTPEEKKAFLKKIMMEIFFPSYSIIDILESVIESKGEGKEVDENKTEPLESLKDRIGIIKEIAISRRIDTAEKVTIEEFYDNRDDIHIGVTADTEGARLGLGKNNERVVKRIYTFEGWREGGLDLLGKDFLEKIFNITDTNEIKEVIVEEVIK